MRSGTLKSRLKYALLAVIFAAGTVVLIEEAGTALKLSYSGLAGWLSAPGPAAGTVSSPCGEQASQPAISYE